MTERQTRIFSLDEMDRLRETGLREEHLFNGGWHDRAKKAYQDGLAIAEGKDEAAAARLSFRAALLRLAGQPDFAIRELLNGLEVLGPEASVLVELARCYHACGEFVQQVRSSEAAIGTDIANTYAWFEKGRGEQSIGEIAAAVSSYCAAVELNPTFYPGDTVKCCV